MRRVDSDTPLKAIIRRVLARDDISLDDQTTASDVPGWDSFKMIEILMAIQSELGVTLDTEDIDGIRNLRDFQTRIDDKLSAPRKGARAGDKI